MTAPHDIDPQAFLSDLLTQASPDLMRQMLTTFIINAAFHRRQWIWGLNPPASSRQRAM